MDPASIDDTYCRGLIDTMRDSGAWLEITDASNHLEVPCFVCYVWSSDVSSLYAGSGSHSDPGVALSRAITEAAQTRLTVIAGTRDDMWQAIYRLQQVDLRRPAAAKTAEPWPEIIANCERLGRDDLVEELDALARHVERHTSQPVLVVDLKQSLQVDVVKVVAPGLRFVARHEVPRREATEPSP